MLPFFFTLEVIRLVLEGPRFVVSFKDYPELQPSYPIGVLGTFLTKHLTNAPDGQCRSISGNDGNITIRHKYRVDPALFDLASDWYELLRAIRCAHPEAASSYVVAMADIIRLGRPAVSDVRRTNSTIQGVKALRAHHPYLTIGLAKDYVHAIRGE